MLKELTIKNFRSFNDEATFSMEADIERVSEHKEHLVNINDNTLLKVSSMYGPNGGGKSNLIKALTLPKLLLGGNKLFKSYTELKCIYSDCDAIEETIFFVTDEFEIGYDFSFSYQTKDVDPYSGFIGYKEICLNILREAISFRKKGDDQFIELIYRDKTGKVESAFFNEINIPQLAVGLSAAFKIYNDYANNEYNDGIAARVIRALYNEISSIKNLSAEIHYYNPKIINKYKDRLLSSLANLDILISDIKISDNDNNNDIHFEREVNINGETKKREIIFSQESAGTRKIFDILYKLVQGENEEVIFYADDLNSFLHPKLFKAIIELFNSNENSNSQLTFNSHDISAMNNELFRRDEIWFAYRDSNYSSRLLALSNIVNYKGEQVRKDAKYNKQYLEGKYGADPFIRKGLDWFEK